MNYRFTPKVTSNFSSTNNRFGAKAASITEDTYIHY